MLDTESSITRKDSRIEYGIGESEIETVEMTSRVLMRKELLNICRGNNVMFFIHGSWTFGVNARQTFENARALLSSKYQGCCQTRFSLSWSRC